MSHDAASWLEIDLAAYTHNVATFRRLVGPERELMAVVKADAYGHGAVACARAALAAGASWLGVFDLDEGLELRGAEIKAPILVLGPLDGARLHEAARQNLRLSLAGVEAVEALRQRCPTGLQVHLKIETGTHRQGVMREQLTELRGLSAIEGLGVEGAYSHYADIEDSTDHSYARGQLEAFCEALTVLKDLGIEPRLRHMSCSAAALLFEETFFDLVRVGISSYGLWPSRETRVSVQQIAPPPQDRPPVELRPVMSWKTRVAQVKPVPAGASVAYGRTYQTGRPSRLAVLPVGYANGYPRGLSGQAHVLLRGRRARLAGRVMMNMIVVDVTDVPGACEGDEVVIMGRQGDESLSADQLATWAGTINYEIVTRAEPRGPRVVIPANKA